MKIKIDENLPESVVGTLSQAGHDVHTVHQERLTGAEDAQVWEACQRERRLLITQDLDFSDVRRFAPGTHAGILLLRLRNPSSRELIERVRTLLTIENIEEWAGCFVVVSDRKVRVTRPTR